MITIFKYAIVGANNKIELPKGAEVLSVASQNHKIFMWAKIDTEAKTEVRNFEVFGTGHEMTQDIGIDYTFIGTAHMISGLVFHVFEYKFAK